MSTSPTMRNGIVGEQTAGGTPVEGGTLSFSPYFFVNSLDPTVNQAAGAVGGSEMAAVYDVLMRYDAGKGEYVPQLARSFTESDDRLSWTLKLREGVTFSDDTPLDAQAVVASINRYDAKRGAFTELWKDSVSSTDATDPLTVKFTLKRPWHEFPTLLALGHGMIVAPSSTKQGALIGAGPYTVDHLAPNTELVLKPRADYWAGPPKLGTLRFVAIQGDSARADTLSSGGVQAGFFLDSAVVSKLHDANFPGYVTTQDLGRLVQINNREGRPGADVRVRQAIAYALNADTFNQRVNAGMGVAVREIFPSGSKWHTDEAALPYDPAKAKELVAAAKADGFDGRISFYRGISTPAARNTALAVQAMLQAVGFTVPIADTSSAAPNATVYVDHNYDLAIGAFSLFESAPLVRLYGALQSSSNNNAAGYSNPKMDALLRTVQTAQSVDAKRSALGDVQKLVNETVPFVTLATAESFAAWQKNVHGVNPTIDGIMLFGDAWVGPGQ